MTFLKHLLWSLVVTFAVAGAGCGDDDTTPDAAPQQPADAAMQGTPDAPPAADIDAAPTAEIDAAPVSDIDAGDLTADAG